MPISRWGTDTSQEAPEGDADWAQGLGDCLRDSRVQISAPLCSLNMTWRLPLSPAQGLLAGQVDPLHEVRAPGADLD